MNQFCSAHLDLAPSESTGIGWRYTCHNIRNIVIQCSHKKTSTDLQIQRNFQLDHCNSQKLNVFAFLTWYLRLLFWPRVAGRVSTKIFSKRNTCNFCNKREEECHLILLAENPFCSIDLTLLYQCIFLIVFLIMRRYTYRSPVVFKHTITKYDIGFFNKRTLLLQIWKRKYLKHKHYFHECKRWKNTSTLKA